LAWLLDAGMIRIDARTKAAVKRMIRIDARTKAAVKRMIRIGCKDEGGGKTQREAHERLADLRARLRKNSRILSFTFAGIFSACTVPATVTVFL
jgi:hypothetical protein